MTIFTQATRSLLRSALVLGVVTFALVTTPPRAAAFLFTVFDFPAAPSTQANGINNRGWIVGEYETDDSGAFHGFLAK